MRTNAGILILIGLLLFSGSVAAADFAVINQGATIYIGEEGLNVTHALNQAQGSPDADGIPPLTAIGWWASGDPAGLPARTLDLGPGRRYACMTAASSDFSGYTGLWYLLAPGGTEPFSAGAQVFTVLDHVPTAGFTADLSTGTAPLTITFTDMSAGYPTEWNWSFGDGSPVNATDRNPVHTYATAGSYTVSLNATNDGGSDTKSVTGYITVYPPAPVADFTASPTSGTVPLTVVFTDTSENNPTGWNWSFGDGSIVNATDRNPVHTYATAGSYTVSLNATNDGGSHTKTMTGYITVYPPAPVADFTGSPLSGPAPLTVLFTDISENNPAEWNWSFGDGSPVNATDRNPVHTYARAGTYTVSLNVTNAGGSGSRVNAGFITVFGRPAVANTSPKSGPASGGTLVTINGAGFSGASAVRFGAVPAPGPTSVSATRITVRTPAHAAGMVNVTVVTPNGTSVYTPAARFTYIARPAVTGISPKTGPAPGGTLVTINGTGFSGASAVRFGNAKGANLSVLSATRIRVTAPAHPAGTVNITVTAPGGTSANASVARYTYAARPTITGISPKTGPAPGGTLVIITGTGFSGATAVRFGNAKGANLSVLSATRIRVTAPAHPAGTVNVTVTAPGGTSANTTAGRFTYY